MLLIILSLATIAVSGANWKALGSIVIAYFILDIAYCRVLKRYAIIDVVVLSVGFVLRILAGSAATGIVPSQWLVLMTFLLTLLLGLAKRRDDVVRMQHTGIAPRHNTKQYNLTFINQAVTVTASVTLVCYIMYTMTYQGHGSGAESYAYLTSIFVMLGLLRYMQIAALDQDTGDPTKLLYRDRFLQITILMWLLSFGIIIYG